jgi:calcium-dependent protein kinase
MLLSGYPPFHGSDETMRARILEAEVDYSHRRRWAKVSEDSMDFVKALLEKDPQKRLDTQAALSHRWLQQSVPALQKPVLGAAALRSIGRYADGSLFRRAVLQLVARELAPVDVGDLRRTFLDIAGDEEGTVNFLELKEAIRGDEPAQQGDADPKTPARRLRRAKTEHLRDLFQVMDANGDEQVYFSDFLAATMSENLREAHLRTAFHRLDADHSGTISTADMENAIGETFEGMETRLMMKDAGLSPSNEGEMHFNSFVRALEM